MVAAVFSLLQVRVRIVPAPAPGVDGTCTPAAAHGDTDTAPPTHTHTHIHTLARAGGVQYLLNYLALEVSGGNYTYVNAALLIMSVPLLALPIHIQRSGRVREWLYRRTSSLRSGLSSRRLLVATHDVDDHLDSSVDGGGHELRALP